MRIIPTFYWIGPWPETKEIKISSKSVRSGSDPDHNPVRNPDQYYCSFARDTLLVNKTFMQIRLLLFK